MSAWRLQYRVSIVLLKLVPGFIRLLQLAKPVRVTHLNHRQDDCGPGHDQHWREAATVCQCPRNTRADGKEHECCEQGGPDRSAIDVSEFLLHIPVGRIAGVGQNRGTYAVDRRNAMAPSSS